MFLQEEIPDRDLLYRWVLDTHVKRNNRVRPNTFQLEKNGVKGLSCDWDKYATPQQALEAGKKKKPTEKFVGVIGFIVSKVRADSSGGRFIVEHRPTQRQAHSVILAENNPENRIRLHRLYEKTWFLTNR